MSPHPHPHPPNPQGLPNHFEPRAREIVNTAGRGEKPSLSFSDYIADALLATLPHHHHHHITTTITITTPLLSQFRDVFLEPLSYFLSLCLPLFPHLTPPPSPYWAFELPSTIASVTSILGVQSDSLPSRRPSSSLSPISLSHTHTYVYAFLCVYVCECLVWGRQEGGAVGSNKHLLNLFFKKMLIS